MDRLIGLNQFRHVLYATFTIPCTTNRSRSDALVAHRFDLNDCD
jgi:hypothetical protein